MVYSLGERLWPMCTHDILVHKLPFQKLCGLAHAAREKVRLVNRPIPTLRSDFRGGNHPAGYYDSNVARTGEPY